MNSSRNNGELQVRRVEFDTRLKMHSLNNRLEFLKSCIKEQVLPKSAPKQLRLGNHPFPQSAQLFLEEACGNLKHKIQDMKARLQGIHLPHYQVKKIQAKRQEQATRLRHKLQTLCRNSPWTQAGRQDLVLNLSAKPLSTLEQEALSLGFKYDTGETYKPLSHYLIKNSTYKDQDIEKGFKQGLTTACFAMSKSNFPALPKRYIQTLQELRKDKTRTVTQADKGGGVVIWTQLHTRKR